MGKVSLEQSIPEWAVTKTSEANTAQDLTKAAVADHRHVITGFEVVLSAAAAAGDIPIQLKDGDAVKWQTFIGKGAAQGERVGVVFAHGIEMSTNTAVNLSVGAGGAGAVTSANMAGYTRSV